MRRFVLLAAAAILALSAHAEERRKLNALAIYGTWLGTQGALPPNCDVDGFVVSFASEDGIYFRMRVAPRTGGVAGKNVISDYTALAVPPSVPLRLEIYLKGKTGDLGIDQLTGSTLELVPAGPDNTYPATSLYLRRCGT